MGSWMVGPVLGPGGRSSPKMTSLCDFLNYKKPTAENWLICIIAQRFNVTLAGPAPLLAFSYCRSRAVCVSHALPALAGPGSSWAKKHQRALQATHSHRAPLVAMGVLLEHLNQKGLKASVLLRSGNLQSSPGSSHQLIQFPC